MHGTGNRDDFKEIKRLKWGEYQKLQYMAKKRFSAFMEFVPLKSRDAQLEWSHDYKKMRVNINVRTSKLSWI